METYLSKILFSSVTYNYTSEIEMDSIWGAISKKTSIKPSLFSPTHYNVIFEKDSLGFSLIRKGSWLPIKASGKIDTANSPYQVSLEFKSFISPLFILGPILLFLVPMIFSERFISNNSPVFSVLCVIFFIVLTILFVHIPIQKEKKVLETELKLKPL